MWLEQWWSPEEIARRLRIEFPDDETMHVSHETIYSPSSSKAAVSCAESSLAAQPGHPPPGKGCRMVC
jgi:IS30 family transposase